MGTDFDERLYSLVQKAVADYMYDYVKNDLRPFLNQRINELGKDLGKDLEKICAQLFKEFTDRLELLRKT